MGLNHSPRIVTDGLVLCLDAANPKSYSGSGTTWTDISGRSNHGTINGTVSYVSNGYSSYFNWATAGDSNYIFNSTPFTYLDLTIVFYPDFSLASSIAGIVASGAPNTDKSLRFTGVNGTSAWTLSGRNPGDSNDWASGTATTYYINGKQSINLVSGWNILGGYRTNQSSYPVSAAYYLGSSGYAGRGFKGRIAACYFYNRQLSELEQTQNFNALRGRYGI